MGCSQWKLECRLLLLDDDAGWAKSIVFSPDGTRVISAAAFPSGFTDPIRLQNTQAGSPLINIVNCYITCMFSTAISLGCMLAACASHDGTTRVWGVQNGILVTRLLEGHTDAVTSLVFSFQISDIGSILA